MHGHERIGFAAHLRRLRVQAGLTQQELANRSGVSARSVSDLERGIIGRPRRDTATMLATGLGLSGEELNGFLQAARPRLAATSAERPTVHVPPLPDGQLLGRESELSMVATALLGNEAQLITLTGPGGVGKTRLALEAMHAVSDRFADGVHFIRLDGLYDPCLVMSALAAALHVQDAGDESSLVDRLVTRLAGREMLIILDNLEHLLDASRDLAELLTRTPQTRLLVTSRESLRVRGERVIPITPLPRPEPGVWQTSVVDLQVEDFPAIALFVQRALTTCPDLAVDPAQPEGRTNLAVIAETCHRLDGLPLAIELAAAQAQFLSPAAILSLLKNAGLPLLSGGPRDQPARLQTMEAAIAWSYNLLSPLERVLFRALSVFAGGFTLPAAAAVALAASEGLAAAFDPRQPLVNLDAGLLAAVASLARQHLLVQDATAPPEAGPRFRMLEPIRLFALDRLREAGDEPGARLRHASFFATLAELLDPLTLLPDPEIWLRQQAADLDNYRSAMDWSLAAGEDDLAVRITCNIVQLWEIRGGLAEARQRVAHAIAVDASSSPANRWFLRFWAETFALDSGDREEAIRYARELLEIARRHDDQLGISVGLTCLSRAIGAFPNRQAEAADLARQGVEILEPLGLSEWTGGAWSRLGIEYHRLGRLDEGRDALLRSLGARREQHREAGASYSLTSLAAVLLDLGQPESALDAYLESLDLTVKHENWSLMLVVLLGIADVAWRCGNDSHPERPTLLLFGAAEALRKRHGLGRESATHEVIARWQTPMRRSAGHEAVDTMIAAGMALPLEDVVALAEGLQVTACRESDSGPQISLLRELSSIE
jgi:predicted ATPase/transcriptional regulator with XRE-family HTH domain